MARVSARTGITAERVVRELARVAFANLADLVKWGPDGITLADSAGLAADDTAAVAEVSDTEFKGKRTLALKLHGKQAALEILAKRFGIDKAVAEQKDDPAMIDQFYAALDAKVLTDGDSHIDDSHIDGDAVGESGGDKSASE
jgi:phage terminase small subunit